MYVRAIDAGLPFWADRSAPVDLAWPRRPAPAVCPAPAARVDRAAPAFPTRDELCVLANRVAQAEAKSAPTDDIPATGLASDAASADRLAIVRRRLAALREAAEAQRAEADPSAALEALAARAAEAEAALSPESVTSYGGLLAQSFQGSLYIQPVRHLPMPYPVKGMMVDSVI